MITDFCFSLLDPAGKPGTPEITDWDVDRVDLKWTAPKNTGGVPITGYVIEKKERFGSNWEEILTTDVSRRFHFHPIIYHHSVQRKDLKLKLFKCLET